MDSNEAESAARGEYLLDETVEVTRTVSESDVYQFAGASGDQSPNHIDRRYARSLGLEDRVAHGVLLLGYTSTASSEVVRRLGRPALSYGYERLRFTKAVPIGRTITATCTPRSYEAQRALLHCDVRVIDEHDDVCLVADHLLKLVQPTGTSAS